MLQCLYVSGPSVQDLGKSVGCKQSLKSREDMSGQSQLYM